MSQENETNDPIERFISDWYWDEKSHDYARQLGRFLFGFLDSLKAQGFSEKTINKHWRNCYLIGVFDCGYGYRDRFSPKIVFSSPDASYEYEFKRKVSDSDYAVSSYNSTWRKVHNYTKKLGAIQ
ncbi:hypothetical protein [Thiocystis violacea]|uniref:hypothetical protein n=1 Tax=Thiocystis violacea TaxID=13725 RepID=UPI0019076CAF|nr:hypothetical protein [Thiocystis violacea]MBK1724267.1 hypothetical protein [Thiocystis violacea]